ncbi:hypothetical protein EGJ27_09565 [Pseudomonas sp. v388]|uniref:DUF2515 family protein n=1 Tax=Pseudomonas sp. v388 TaxID=2479849 RepID=UPI000F77847E|nr:hypothetical protein [Pseudomonas sp. v388]RRV08286.1 hypothetical protein EGJ27_09565 [Pseudomonas sp. v388]
MSQRFQDSDSDQKKLNQNVRPISECERKRERLYDVTTDVVHVPVLTCEGLWRIYQSRAEDVVAPGGELIANPIERNRAINAAYAKLWLDDPRFQWAGLAAFASKTVGCGLLHARDSIDKIQKEYEASQKIRQPYTLSDLVDPNKVAQHARYERELEAADDDNPFWSINARLPGSSRSLTQEGLLYVYEKMALGNTTLFLDIYPLHLFYAQRGLNEFEECLKKRESIYGHPKFPVQWPVDQQELGFGVDYDDILLGFEALDSGHLAKSVRHLANHEQRNILQPIMYDDWKLDWLLFANHFYYVTRISPLPDIAQPIELTLASQCKRIDDDRTVTFDSSPLADLSDIDQRMAFVLRAARQFDELLRGSSRGLLEQSIRDIAAGQGVR